jgi:hypothetical protein
VSLLGNLQSEMGGDQDQIKQNEDEQGEEGHVPEGAFGTCCTDAAWNGFGGTVRTKAPGQTLRDILATQGAVATLWADDRLISALRGPAEALGEASPKTFWRRGTVNREKIDVVVGAIKARKTSILEPIRGILHQRSLHHFI